MEIRNIARVGKFDVCDVQVWTDDDSLIPIVHIMKDVHHYTANLENDVCFMPTDMRKAFYEFMCQPSRNVHYRNNYEAAVNLWNDNNSNSYIKISDHEDKNGNIIVPDYRNIMPYK